MGILKSSLLILFSLLMLGSVQIPKNKVAMLSFWATWCDACKAELMTLDRSLDFEKFSKDPKFTLILVNVDQDSETAKAWVKQNLKNVKFEIFYEPDFNSAEAFHIDSFPAILLFDRSGKEVKRVSQFDLSLLLNDLKSLMGE